MCCELIVAPAGNVHTTHTCSMFSHICLYAVCVVCVRRFVQFADSGYEADPEIDGIEQQASM